MRNPTANSAQWRRKVAESSSLCSLLKIREFGAVLQEPLISSGNLASSSSSAPYSFFERGTSSRINRRSVLCEKMATFLRSMKHIRNFSSMARRSGLLSGKFQPALDSHQALRCFSVRNNTYDNNSSVGFTEIEKKLLKIDEHIVRLGRVSYNEVWDLLQKFRETGKIQSTQALLLIRCCGANMPHKEPHFRAKLAQEVWDTLLNLGVPMDISHYNALLRVNSENNVEFSPVEFLQEILEKGLSPNRITYQRLIACYCDKGDIEGANQILQHMKEKELPLNEQIFNCLITGHANANDLESAVQVVELMKDSGIPPSVYTYVSLINAYAKFGKTEDIQKMLEEIDKLDVFLHQPLMQIIYALTKYGQEEHVDQVLLKMTRGPGYGQDAITLIYRLLNDKKVEVALKVYDTLIKRTDGKPVSENTGYFLINHMVETGKYPLEEILRVCKILANGKNLSDLLYVAISAGQNIRDPDLIMGLLKEYRDAGEPIREHYFWPVLKVHVDAANYNVILKTLKTIIEEYPPMPLFTTLTMYVIPYAVGSTLEKYRTLVDLGLEPFVVANSIAVELLMHNRMRETTAFLEEVTPAIYTKIFRTILVETVVETLDNESFVKILKTIQNTPELNGEKIKLYEELVQRDFVEYSITTLLEKLPQQKLSFVDNLVDALYSMRVRVSQKIVELIDNLLHNPDVKEKLRNLPKIDNVKRWEDMLENKSESGEPVVGLTVRLLCHYLEQHDFQNAASMAKKLLEQDWTCSKSYAEYLIRLFSEAGIQDAADAYYGLISQKEWSCSLRISLVYARMLIDAGHFDDAVNVILKAKSDSSSSLKVVLVSLFKTAGQRCEPEQVEKLISVVSQKIPYELPPKVYGSIVEAYLQKDDLNMAIEKFAYFTKTLKYTVAKNPLLKKLVMMEDANALQQVVDLISNVRGEVLALYDLIFTFLECGRIRQARKILEMPNMILQPKQFQYFGMKSLREGSRANLERLIEVTRGLNMLNRHEFYETLLSLHDQNNDWESALNIWTDMQDDNVATSNTFLITLAELLRKNNQAVPFVVPCVSKSFPELRNEDKAIERIKSAKSNPKEVESIYYSLPHELKIKQRVVEITCQALASEEKFSTVQKVLEYWLSMRPQIRCKSLWHLFNVLSKAGQTKIIQHMERFISDEQQRNRISTKRHIIASFIYRKDFENFLDNCLRQPPKDFTGFETAKGFRLCVGLILPELAENPSLVEKFESVVAMYKGEAFGTIGSVLLLHYLSKDMDDKVTKLMETLMVNDPKALNRCSLVCFKNDFGDLLKKLQSKVENSSLANDIKVFVNCELIHFFVKNNEPNLALRLYHETMKKYNTVTPIIENFIEKGYIKDNKVAHAQQEEAPERVTEAAA